MTGHPKIRIIAEAGVNHNGSTEQALALIDAAAASGASIVGEAAIAQVVGRSIVAAQPIAPGERFSEDNLTTKRPADDLPPLRLWELVGVTARRVYAKDELIS